MSSGGTGQTNKPAPATAVEIGIVDDDGKLQAVSSTNPLPIDGSITATNPSVDDTGAPVPASATYVGMDVGGNLIGLTGTANGLKVDGSAVTQPISAESLPLPTDAATEATLAALAAEDFATEATLAAAAADLASIAAADFATEATLASLAANDFATEATLASLAATDFATETTLAAAATDLGTLAGAVAAAKMQVDVVSSDLPAGAATAANQTTANTSLAAINGKLAAGTGAATAAVRTAEGGRVKVANVNQALASVTTGAYTQIVASTAAEITWISAFESSGQGLILATGAAASEVDQLYIPPGGLAFPVPLRIASGTRLSIKALLGNPTDGQLIANFLS